MTKVTNTKPDGATRFLAFLLIAGGLAGIAIFIWLATQSKMHVALIIFFAIFVLLFAWSALKGYDLWLGKPSGYKWAKILFAAQIPSITVPGFNYEYYTGLNMAVLFGRPDSNHSINIGSSAALYLSPEVVGTVFGVNLVAIIALAYLFFSKRVPRSTNAQSID